MTMAISTDVNNEGEKQTAENLDETDKAKVTEPASEIEVLKRETQELSDQNLEVKEKIKKLSLEMADWDEEELESIRKKEVELETNVLRFQDELSAPSTEVEVNNKMSEGLYEENEKLKRRDDEMKPKIDELESEAAKTMIELSKNKEGKRESDIKDMGLEERVNESGDEQSRDNVGRVGLNVPLVIASLVGAAVAVLYLCFRKRS